MDVRVLGTGSADGWPNPFCTCPSCAAERVAGRLRGQTAALVDDVLLLDCGPETPHAAQRAGADLSRLRHVLITHAHPDHCAPAFLLFRSWVGDAPLDVVGPTTVVEQARHWVAPDSTVRFVTVEPGDRLTLGAYDVRVLEASHGDDAVLYDVASSGARLLYATDTGPLPDSTVAAAADAAYDTVLMEETFGDKADHGTDHLHLATFGDQLRRLREVGAVTPHTDVVAVHLSHHNPPTGVPASSTTARRWPAPAPPLLLRCGRSCSAVPGPASRARQSGCCATGPTSSTSRRRTRPTTTTSGPSGCGCTRRDGRPAGRRWRRSTWWPCSTATVLPCSSTA